MLNGFSKLYAMTGLRLDYLIAPQPFIRGLQRMQQSFFISASSPARAAGIAALEDSAADVATMKRLHNEGRVYMVERLKELGLGITVEPTGAFYVFANAKHPGMGSLQLAFDILEKARVGVARGIDFGPHGEGYLRFSYAAAMEGIAEGLNRIEAYLRQADAPVMLAWR